MKPMSYVLATPPRQRSSGRRVRLALLLSLLLVQLVVACAPREPLSDAEIRQQLETFFENRAQQERFSGTLLVARDGVPVVAQAYGWANKQLDLRNQVETVYRLASLGKMFTAVAIGQLVEQGRLTLDDPLSAHLPDYPAEVASRVSIKQLLSHASGIPDFMFVDPPAYEPLRDSRDPQRDFIPVIAGKPLDFEPGSRYAYSNSNFLLLGAIIERVSGQSYYDYVREHIFEPAGMRETFWTAAEVPAERLALGYSNVGPQGEQDERVVVDSNWVSPMGYNPEPVMAGGYGGNYSTAGDLLRFLQALRRHTLLSEQSTELLFTDQIDTEFAGYRYALGFMVHSADGLRAIGHSGGGPATNTEAYMYPRGYDMLLLSNYDNINSEALVEQLDAVLMRSQPGAVERKDLHRD